MTFGTRPKQHGEPTANTNFENGACGQMSLVVRISFLTLNMCSRRENLILTKGRCAMGMATQSISSGFRRGESVEVKNRSSDPNRNQGRTRGELKRN